MFIDSSTRILKRVLLHNDNFKIDLQKIYFNNYYNQWLIAERITELIHKMSMFHLLMGQ